MPLTFSTSSGDVTTYNVTGLEPDTRYIIQVYISANKIMWGKVALLLLSISNDLLWNVN